MLTILAMAAVATVAYATVATAIRWIEKPERIAIQRFGGWALLLVALSALVVVIAAAGKDVVIGFCIGGLVAPVMTALVERKRCNSDDR
ncbi:hypothetical protein LQL77_31035 [Rhodococcus cerastii]|nr:hypothetical protein [Rhodococcus cerastii]